MSDLRFKNDNFEFFQFFCVENGESLFYTQKMSSDSKTKGTNRFSGKKYIEIIRSFLAKRCLFARPVHRAHYHMLLFVGVHAARE